MSLESIQLGHVNAALAILLLIVAGASFHLFWTGSNTGFPTPVLSPSGSPPSEEVVRPRAEAWYVARICDRNVFQPLIKPPPPVPEPAAVTEKMPTPAPRLADLLKSYTLRGIMSGSSPRVVLYDSRSDKVYFLGQGEEIGASGIRVKSIGQRDVVFALGDEEAGL